MLARNRRSLLQASVLLILAIISGIYIYTRGHAAGCTVTLSPGVNVGAAFNSPSLTAGQTLCLHTGNYGGPTSAIALTNGGTSGSPITLTTVPGEAPATIEGGFTVGNNSTSGLRNNITVSHINFKLNLTDNNRVNAQYGCSSTRVLGVTLTGSNIIFEYNDVSEASVSPAFRDTPLGANFTGVRSSNVIIRNNKIHDFGACDHFDHGIYFDYVDNGQIYGNWIWNGGCAYGLGGDPTKGCGAGIQLYSDPIGTQVYGNVIDGAGIGMYLSKNHNNVYNNVIMNIKGMYRTDGVFESPYTYSGYAGDATNTFVNNNYFNAGPLCSDCSATSTVGGQQSNISSNPMFTDPAAHNYTLKVGSPITAYSGMWNGDLSNGVVAKVGDINGDNVVNILDLSILLSAWNTNNSSSDLNKDGSVGIFDLSILLSHYGN